MADVLVRQCTIRVVRRSGWSWGHEPRALLERVLRRVPGLIERELQRLFADEEDLEIGAPIRVAIPVSLAMLEAVAAEDAENMSPAFSSSDATLMAPVKRALEQVLGRHVPLGQPASQEKQPEVLELPLATRRECSIVSADPLSVLCQWAKSGYLDARLRDFSESALRAWHGWIAGLAPKTAPIPDSALVLFESLLARFAVPLDSLVTNKAERLRQNLELMAAFELAVPGALRSMDVGALIDAVPVIEPKRAPATDDDLASAAQEFTASAVRPARKATAAVPPPVRLAASPEPRIAKREAFDVRIECALPFLLLGPLARVGYLDLASAVLAAAGIPHALPHFATALAYKVLPPPVHGWLRTRATATAAAALGLLAEAPPDSELGALARNLRGQESPLNALIAGALIDGHRLGTPLLLTAIGPAHERLMLSDVDGAFLIGIAERVEGLLPLMRRVLHEIVLVSGAAASPSVLAALTSENIRFVTDVPPCRGENWRAVERRPGEVWWSNDDLSSNERLAACGRLLSQSLNPANACWLEIGSKRPSIPRSTELVFEDTLSLAAGLGLGSIAWELWHECEPTSPQLALERFQSFDARVRVDSETVRVLLPLGRRFFDLERRGFLGDVHGIPWFDGRVLSFSTG